MLGVMPKEGTFTEGLWFCLDPARVIRSATAAIRGPLLSLMALAATLSLGACTTVGPDFARPQVPWLRDWSSGEWRALVDAAPPRAPVPYDEWWRTFGDPALDRLVAEAQRVNPGVLIAGMRIMEARAKLGIAGSALYPQLQQVTGEVLRVGSEGSDSREAVFGHAFWSAEVGLRHRLGDRLLGKVQAWHRIRRRRVLRQHRAVR